MSARKGRFDSRCRSQAAILDYTAGNAVSITSRRRRSLPTPLRHPLLRFAIIFGLDAAIAVASLWLAMLLRFEGAIDQVYRLVLPQYIVLLAACRLSANYLARIHRWSFSFPGLQDAMRVGTAA